MLYLFYINLYSNKIHELMTIVECKEKKIKRPDKKHTYLKTINCWRRYFFYTSVFTCNVKFELSHPKYDSE